MGPLPRHCGHEHPPLIGSTPQGGFTTGPTAAYPEAMNQMLASLVFDHWFNRAPTPLEGDRKSHAGPRESISRVPGEGISSKESVAENKPPPAPREGISRVPGGGISPKGPILEGKSPSAPQDPSLELAPPKPEGVDTPGYAMRGQGGKQFHDGAGLLLAGQPEAGL